MLRPRRISRTTFTRTEAPGFGGARAWIAAAVAVGLVGVASPVQASPWTVPSSVARVAATSAQPEAATTIDGALEAGDLQTAQQLAQQAREADPTAANWQREGEVFERSGEYQQAAVAYRSAGKVAAEDAEALAAADEGLYRVRAASRGTVFDEPESTHRERLDKNWAPPKPPPKPEPTPEPTPVTNDGDGRIVTKWYFWVTVGAIAASAAAVTAIAIRAARDDQPDALDSLAPAPPSRGLGVLRF